MNATDPIIAGINYHHDHKTAEGATSNPATVQAHIDRSLSTESLASYVARKGFLSEVAEDKRQRALKFWQTVNLFDHTF
jgi:hypothetical protein